MICSSCNHENRAEAKFCEECAAPLKRVCGSCGAELRPTAKFCDECGSATASGAKEGPDAYVTSVATLWDLAPDTRGEMGLLWPAYDRHGAITVLNRGGMLPEGGAFESVYLYLVLTAHGQINHVEMFEIDAVDEILEFFSHRLQD